MRLKMYFSIIPPEFPSYVDDKYICRLDAAVLDLVADDSASMQKQKSVFHWDKVF